jgi:hypothetical protein
MIRLAHIFVSICASTASVPALFHSLTSSPHATIDFERSFLTSTLHLLFPQGVFASGRSHTQLDLIPRFRGCGLIEVSKFNISSPSSIRHHDDVVVRHLAPVCAAVVSPLLGCRSSSLPILASSTFPILCSCVSQVHNTNTSSNAFPFTTQSDILTIETSPPEPTSIFGLLPPQTFTIIESETPALNPSRSLISPISPDCTSTSYVYPVRTSGLTTTTFTATEVWTTAVDCAGCCHVVMFPLGHTFLVS